jgi:osmotically inducible protein OsmC
MKAYARHASARWVGTRQRGKGAINTPSAALKIALHPGDGDARGSGTNPAELIAAAIAGSFSLALADELGQAGYKPREIDIMATVTLEHLAAGWTLTQILLAVTATVPRAAECDFVDATLRAKAGCPISRALSVNTLMTARLTRKE